MKNLLILIFVLFYFCSFSQSSFLYKKINKSNFQFYKKNIRKCKKSDSNLYYKYLEIIIYDKKITKEISNVLASKTKYFPNNNSAFFFIEGNQSKYFSGLFWFDSQYIHFTFNNSKFSYLIFTSKIVLAKYDYRLFKLIELIENPYFEKYNSEICLEKYGSEEPCFLINYIKQIDGDFNIETFSLPSKYLIKI